MARARLAELDAELEQMRGQHAALRRQAARWPRFWLNAGCALLFGQLTGMIYLVRERTGGFDGGAGVWRCAQSDDYQEDLFSPSFFARQPLGQNKHTNEHTKTKTRRTGSCRGT